MPALDLMDETYIAAAPSALRDSLCDEQVWRAWFPEIVLTCFEDRGTLGKRWSIGGALIGTGEIWLEEVAEGTIVHAFLQAEPSAGGRSTRRTRSRLHRVYAHALKANINALKDSVDADRPSGDRPTHLPESGSGGGRVVLTTRSQEDIDGKPDDE